MALKIKGKSEEGASGSGTDRINFKDKYDIAPGSPLPHLDTPPAVAYAAFHPRDNSSGVFALVCDPKLPPRLHAVPTFRNIDDRNLLNVLDSGVVHWAPENRMCPVILYRMPQGERVMASLKDINDPMPEDRVARFFISPMAEVLKEIFSTGNVHRAIRPDNLFYDDPNKNIITLGDCLSAPAGVTQPILFEPIENALSHVSGRGESTPAADMYALGITILILLTGRVPCPGMSDEQLINRKMDVGSYGALAENERISLTMMEPLRGLLNDDVQERWSVDDLLLWVSGRRLSPKQQSLPAKASRGLKFQGKEYFTARELARGLADNWDKALTPITNGDLDNWLRRSLSDEDRIDAVNMAKSEYTGSGGSDEDDMLIARVIIALDPAGPIRYRELKGNIGALPGLLAAHADNQEIRKYFAIIVRSNLIAYWMEIQPYLDNELLPVITQFEKLRPILDRRGLGGGMERVIYDLNDHLPCLSPLFETDYVQDIEHLLPAFERLAKTGKLNKRLIDRHVAAFVSARFKRAVNAELRDIEAPEDAYSSDLGQFKLLSAIQLSLPRRPYPRLCFLAVKMLEPAVNRFHGREARDRVRAKLKKSSRKGLLKDVLDIVDNRRELNQDKYAFDTAVREYTRSVRELLKIDQDEQNRQAIVTVVSGQIASMLSVMIAFLAVAVIIATSNII